MIVEGRDLRPGVPHLGAEDPVVLQAVRGDPLRQGLDQVDVALAQQAPDLLHHLGIADHIVVLVVDGGMLDAGQLQVDADALLVVLFVAVDPDPAGQDEVAHEHFHGPAMRNGGQCGDFLRRRHDGFDPFGRSPHSGAGEGAAPWGPRQ